MAAFDAPRRLVSTLGFWLAIAFVPGVSLAQTAQDHRGNRIEPFRQSDIVLDGRENRGLACTADRSWCAELKWSEIESRLTLLIGPEEELDSQSPTYAYILPNGLVGDGGVSIWGTIVIEKGGAVMVGLTLSKETRRSGFRSYQRRLLLLRAEPGRGSLVPVLEVPISSVVEMAPCAAPDERPTVSSGCYNRLYFDTLFTLVPLLAPDRPALVMVARAVEYPGETPAPACTFTRSFFFDPELGWYVPDAPYRPAQSFLTPDRDVSASGQACVI